MCASSTEALPPVPRIGRRRGVPLAARIADKLARVIITVGGISVIVTVFGVFVYLLIVVIPLFLPGSIEIAIRINSHEILRPPAELSTAFSASSARPPQPAADHFGASGRTGAGLIPVTAKDRSANREVARLVSEDTSGNLAPEDSPESGQICLADTAQLIAASTQEGTQEPDRGQMAVLPRRSFVASDQPTTIPPFRGSSSDDHPQLICDEAVTTIVVVGRGWARAFALPSGKPLGEYRLVPKEQTIVAWRFNPADQRWLASTEHGSLYVGRWDFESTTVEPENLPAELRAIPVGSTAPYGDGVLRHVSRRQYQLVRVKVDEQPEVNVGDSPLVLLDAIRRGNLDVVVGLSDDGFVYRSQLVRQKNLLTGQVTIRASTARADVKELIADCGVPAWLLVFGQGDSALLLWKDGTFRRFDLSDPNQPRAVESGTVAADGLGPPRQVCFLLGRNTLLVGHESGLISGWFLVPDETRADGDHRRLVRGHVFGTRGKPVTALAAARRSRLFAACYGGEHVRLLYATSQRMVAEWEASTSSPLFSLAFSPRDDFLLTTTAGGVELAALRVPHPEVSWRSIWTRVWYEGYPRPAHVWQSTGGTDDFEPKYGMVPLVFGTLKATFYSLLFGLPLAFLAAVYTSEFLHTAVRSRVKPMVEMMASLPSVVLGFVAAFVVAPLVEKHVPAVLCFFGTLPVALLFCGHLWEMLPFRVRNTGWLRFLGLLGAIYLGGVLAWKLGPIVEQVLFSGDIKRWLSGDLGEGWGGWILLWLPAAALATVWINTRWIKPIILDRMESRSRLGAGVSRLFHFFVSVFIVCVIAYGAALVCDSLLGDPRGNLLGTYVQRNALVVGIIMGFAIIPIIFTLSEDALAAVPQELRAASLASGATPWQTVFRVVVPAAMSGLFSAAMVGLGRAAGETMIVLMAAGNTPILEWNPFNGFRTLSANIAVELPEAVQGSTHYRMLFFAALCLFAMTLVINTIAELVRMRFRQQTARL